MLCLNSIDYVETSCRALNLLVYSSLVESLNKEMSQ